MEIGCRSRFMGRLMTATSMLGVMMKGDNESVTVNVHGDGPMGTIVAVAEDAGEDAEDIIMDIYEAVTVFLANFATD